MKKDLSLLIGIAALLVTVFIAAFFLYDGGSQKSDNPTPPRIDESRLVPEDAPTLGPSLARVTLVEFLDPECESCAAMHPIVKRVMSESQGRVRLVIRYMPLHGNSTYAATALEAAALQGQYWQALDALFTHQAEWGSHANPQPQKIPEYLEAIGLDRARLEADMKNPKFLEKIKRDEQEGLSLGVRGTPTFFVNGRLLGRLGYEALRDAVQAELDR